MLASMRENVMIQTAVLEDERHSSSVSTMQVLSTNTHALEEDQLALERMQRQLQMIDRRRM